MSKKNLKNLSEFQENLENRCSLSSEGVYQDSMKNQILVKLLLKNLQIFKAVDGTAQKTVSIVKRTTILRVYFI